MQDGVSARRRRRHEANHGPHPSNAAHAVLQAVPGLLRGGQDRFGSGWTPMTPGEVRDRPRWGPRRLWSWSERVLDRWLVPVIGVWLVLLVGVQLGIARGRWLERRAHEQTVIVQAPGGEARGPRVGQPAQGALPGEAAPAGSPPAPLRGPYDCTQAPAWDERGQPMVLSRPLDRLEIEGYLAEARHHWQTAARQVWNERGARHAWIAVAITLWVQACGEAPP